MKSKTLFYFLVNNKNITTKELKMKHLLTILATLSLYAASAYGSCYNSDCYSYNPCYSSDCYSYSSRCIQEFVTNNKKTKYETANQCELIEPLSIGWTNQNYPLMNNNPRRVRYWRGAYTLDAQRTEYYTRTIMDICKGKVLHTEQYEKNYDGWPAVFEINNINLNSRISESFMTVAMTESEALQEMDEALKKCQSYKAKVNRDLREFSVRENPMPYKAN